MSRILYGGPADSSNMFPDWVSSCLDEASRDRLAASSRVLRAPRGKVLFRQGESAACLHVLIEGQVGLSGRVEAEGEETIVEIVEPGQVFLLPAVLTGKPYLMGASALAPSRVVEVPRDVLVRELEQSPALALALLEGLAQRSRQLVQEVKDLKLKSAGQRLAGYLVGLAGKKRGAVQMRLPHNKTVIAARVGVRPETLSRAFAQLKAAGVTVDGQSVRIADIAQLSRYCAQGRENV